VPSIELSGKPIAITGASSGIGMVTALFCARAGMPVTLAARRIDRLESLAMEIRRAGGRAVAVQCDVSRPEDCERVIRRTNEEFGTIYAVFANAGYGIEGGVVELDDRQWREIFEVNFWGTMNVIRPAVPCMLGAGRGHVLICSSVVSKMGVPRLAAYTATKACQDHIGRALRLELWGKVHVSTVHPIGTDTEFSQVVTQRSGNRPRTARSPERFRQSPEEVAEAVLRCLRDPRGEVWTSGVARLLAALGTALPSLADWGLRRHFERKLAGITMSGGDTPAVR
jgi:short-subunit dehydrogenase